MIASLAESVPLTVSSTTDKLVTHKLDIQFVTDRLAIVALVTIASLADNILVTVKFSITESSTDAITVKLSIVALVI